MVYGIYAMYDVALKTYAQPFFQANDDVAKRSFKLAINSPAAGALYSIRDDLELWRVGYFDDREGAIRNDNPEENDKFTKKHPIRIISRGDAVIKEEMNEEV